jgi:opacity protein-like surface antigen
MKKFLGVLLLIACLALGANAAVRIGIVPGFSMGGTLVAADSESTFDGGFSLGFGVGYDLMKYLSLELRGTWANHIIPGSLDGLSQGKMTCLPVELMIVGRFPVGQKLFPYVFGGAGYSFNSFTVDAALVDDWADFGFTLSESIKQAVSFSFGAGLDFAITPQILIGLEGKLVICKADGEWSLEDDTTGEIFSTTLTGMSLNRFIVGIGLKYQF